jgi:iron complex outermembrane recepter protein
MSQSVKNMPNTGSRPTKITLAVATAISIASALTALPTFAQEAKVEKIEVTGSNIKRVDIEGPLPVQVISRDEIVRSAAVSVGDLLRSMPVNSGGSVAENVTNGQSGAAGISLRGLGQKSTLVLINGRRMANHAFANGADTFVDLHSIPKGAVERIEILKDGASAIYGSDAIAGVVNVIFRRDYQGLEFGANSGKASEGGLRENGATISAGFGSMSKDKYNVLAVMDYFDRELMVFGDRPFLNKLDFRFLPGGSFFPATSGGTWVRPAGVTTGPGNRAAMNPCQGVSTLQPAFAPLFQTGTVCQYTVENTLTAFPEAKRIGFFSRGNLELSPSMTAFAEASVSRNESYWINQWQTVTNTTVVFDPATGGFRPYPNIIPLSNPISASNPYGRPASLNYTFFDVGPRTFDLKTDAFRVLAGLSGSVGRWDWNGALGQSQSKISQVTGNQVDANVLRQYIDVGGYNFAAPTAAQTNSLRVSTTRNSTSKLSFADFKATTELMQLPAGAVGFAAGLELRRESMKDVPDPLVQQGRLLGTGSTSTDGSRNVTSAFFEASIPAAKTVEFQLAGRYDRYNDFGSAFSPKIGAKWTPHKDVLVRAAYARGFRAPTLVENAKSFDLGFANVRDTSLPGAPTTLVAAISSGSGKLEAEKSTSTSIGLVWEPTERLSLGIDYYEIEQRNLVSTNGLQFIVDNATLFPGAIVRNAGTGTIAAIFDSYTNIAKVETNGVDFEARWRIVKTDMGSFGLRSNASYITSFKQPPARGATPLEYAGRSGGPNGLVLPRTRGKLALDWIVGDFTATFSGNFTSRYKRGTTGQSVNGYTTGDIYMAYNLTKALKFNLSVTNVEDKNPPIDVGSGVGPTPSLYDLRSRYTRAGVEYKFR